MSLLLPPENYQIVFEDTFQRQGLDSTKWIPKQPWGIIHSEYPIQYYDESSIDTSQGQMTLLQQYKPKKIIDQHGSVLNSQYAIGLVSSKSSWRYGWFEFEVMLPKGVGLWPAVWLTGKNFWPPEIDILEGYTKRNRNYNVFPFCHKRDVQTNVHYNNDDNILNIGAKSHKIPKDPSQNYLKYVCHWTENSIDIYYDNVLVRRVTDRVVLSDMDDDMYIVINNGVDSGYVNKIPDKQVSEFKITSVRVLQESPTI